jgi:hypothetical protein
LNWFMLVRRCLGWRGFWGSGEGDQDSGKEGGVGESGGGGGEGEHIACCSPFDLVLAFWGFGSSSSRQNHGTSTVFSCCGGEGLGSLEEEGIGLAGVGTGEGLLGISSLSNLTLVDITIFLEFGSQSLYAFDAIS